MRWKKQKHLLEGLQKQTIGALPSARSPARGFSLSSILFLMNTVFLFLIRANRFIKKYHVVLGRRVEEEKVRQRGRRGATQSSHGPGGR